MYQVFPYETTFIQPNSRHTSVFHLRISKALLFTAATNEPAFTVIQQTHILAKLKQNHSLTEMLPNNSETS